MKKALLIFTVVLVYACSDMRYLGAHDLSELGNKFHTDKAYFHDYTSIYEKYLSHLKDKPVKFLEIGFGASAHMWDAYFSHPLTSLHFIDIDQNCLNHMSSLSSRCHLHLIDQESKTELRNFIYKAGGDFDIIDDDGGHTMQQQITTFKTLFPYLKSGGVYIIDSLHTSYWQSHGSAGTQEIPKASEFSTIAFLKNLIDDLNYSGARTSCADKNKVPEEVSNSFNYYQKHIHSIHFYSSLCIIIKI